jgi:tripartite-type tricarboxylate transporter receptor subunit TctC
MKTLFHILVAAGATLIGTALHADNYPSKPITLVAVFGPGSASDTICRVIAQPLSAALHESVIVENRPGANGALAAQYVARSAPGWLHAADGH